jgi:hypothetical protein
MPVILPTVTADTSVLCLNLGVKNKVFGILKKCDQHFSFANKLLNCDAGGIRQCPIGNSLGAPIA